MNLRVSLGQMDPIKGEPETNFATAAAMAAEASRRGSHVLMLPELWGSGIDVTRHEEHASATGQGLFARAAALAAEHGLAICGSLLSTAAGGNANTIAFFGRDGRIVTEYSKLHLFRLMDEDKWLVPGNRPALAEGPWGLAGLAICYDLRFPELFRHYALAGARLIFLPSAWPHPRLTHWRTLLRARAIENQMFVVACNRVGTSDGTAFFGHSSVIDPWGELLVEAGEQPGLFTVDFDLTQVEAIRKQIPVFQDRRTDIYG
ncbi:MAG TPA: carbon-nitrogen hydrolase [Chloroflexi bacterium]|nr:carbon-nitrogen hydrolase [Chloroflexota bacterium]